MHIWTLALGAEEHLATNLVAECRALLSDDERARADRFMFDRDRNRYIMAHTLCRLMLSRFGYAKPEEWIFDKEEKGRPFIRPELNSAKLDFNISHTQGMVGCAVSETGRVGFDLEPKNREANLHALVSKQFSTLEQQQFTAAPEEMKAQKFFEFWTLKESYIKLTGNGLSEDLSGFSFDLSGARPECYLGQKHLADHKFDLFDIEASHQGAWGYLPVIENLEEAVHRQPEYSHFSQESFRALF